MSKQTNNVLPRTDRISFEQRKAGPECGPTPKLFGQGADIRFVLPSGDIVQSNPRAYNKLSAAAKEEVVQGVMSALVE